MKTQRQSQIRGRTFWQKKPKESVPLNAHILYSEAVKVGSQGFYDFLPNKCPPLWFDVALWRLDEATHGDDTLQLTTHKMIHHTPHHT